ncbi:MAG: cupin [Actinobacteria bacterium]|nr:cupin [Actinomycetota bacterium]
MSTSALERCVGNAQRFLSDNWSQRPLLHGHEDEGSFDDLASLGDFDHMVSSMFLRTPSFRMVKDGRTLPFPQYTKTARPTSGTIDGVANPAAIYDLFEKGATLVLEGLHRYWRPLSRFCRELEVELGHPVQVNAYITPPASQGFAVHSDDHDVFVLQVYGDKQWQVYDLAYDAGDPTTTLIDDTLSTGCCLYIPKGFPHSARTGEHASAHLTIGVLTHTPGTLLKEVVKLAEKEPLFQTPLPARLADDPDALRQAIRDHLRELTQWIDKVDVDEVAARAARVLATTRHEIVTGQLEQLLALPRLGRDSVVRRRAGSVCLVVAMDDELAVLLADRELRMPLLTEGAMRFIRDREEFEVGELDEHLDEAGSVVLVRRLIREGLLEADI